MLVHIGFLTEFGFYYRQASKNLSKMNRLSFTEKIVWNGNYKIAGVLSKTAGFLMQVKIAGFLIKFFLRWQVKNACKGNEKLLSCMQIWRAKNATKCTA